MRSCINPRIRNLFSLIIVIIVILLFLSCEIPYQVNVRVWIHRVGNTFDVAVSLWDAYGHNKVSNVVVSINGSTLWKDEIQCNAYEAVYFEPFGFWIDDGELINLVMTGGDISVDQTFIMPHHPGEPILVNPCPLDPSKTQPVSWAPIIPIPPQVKIIVRYDEPVEPDSKNVEYFLPGDATDFLIPAGLIPNGTEGSIEVHSYSSARVDGKNIHSDSFIKISNRSSTVASFTTQ